MVVLSLESNVLERVELYLTHVRRDLHLPGLAVGIVQGGHVVFLQGFGKAGPEQAASSETPFVIGSLSKSFTAVALLQLSEAGKIDLDAPVQHYLPWFCVGNDPVASAQITTRHLLTHTSGLSRYSGRELLGQTKNVGMEQRVRDLKKTRLVHATGTVFEYSNSNYLVAGLLIQVVSGTLYQHYLHQHILTPLRMHYHTFLSEQFARSEGLAAGYRWWFGIPLPTHMPFLSDALPAAFLISGVEDMVRWLLFHLSEGMVDGITLLSPEGMKELHTPSVAAGAHSSYALGWRVEHLGNEPILRHGGETANFLAEMVLLPQQDIGIVVLMNCSNGVAAQTGNTRIASGLAKLLLDMQSESTKLSFKQFYGVLNLAVLALSSLQLWSTIRLLRPGRSSRWNTVAMIGDVTVPIITLWCIPTFADSPWSLLRSYVPDVSAWLTGMTILSLTKGLLRGMRYLRAKEQKED